MSHLPGGAMTRSITSLALSLLALTACQGTESGPNDADGAAGGKADDADGLVCGEDRVCLDYASYEVLFTNPICETYAYDAPLATVGGGTVGAKPKNVYCTKEFDSENSGTRDSSPQTRILEWLDETGEGDDIFLAYLSFSDGKVADALCSAIDRGADVTFVLDKIGSKAEQVIDCGGNVMTRGHQGSVGFAHNKILMINPRQAGPADDGEDYVRMSYGSGNMSSGTHLHHENWHFTEVARESFFVQSHLCLIDALLDPAHTDGKAAFRAFMNECRETITAPPEEDLIPYFIPVRDDSKALVERLELSIDEAETIDIGAHRFSFTTMMEALKVRLADAERPFHLRFVADDDLYWLDPLAPSEGSEIGPNTFNEAIKLRELREADGGQGRFEEKYLETNEKLHLLHHNKFLVFEGMPTGRDALMFGSSNLTGTGFEGNLENMYYTDIPEIVGAFQNQFGLFWDGEGQLPEGMSVAPMATAREDMPIELVSVSEPGEVEGDDDVPPPAACGIRIVEVLYDAEGADGGQEWIKLYNSCDTEGSLDNMSLGWGGGSYTRGSADLAGPIGAGACVLVGSETVDATLQIEFSPALQNSGALADGIALFDDRSTAVTETTVPVDAVIYGGSNDDGLIDATGDAPAPHVDDVSAGRSIVRTTASEWDVGEPTPAACPTW
ncbi:MAG: phospholipase D-like domain-containing protein [Myxococcota bacterium]